MKALRGVLIQVAISVLWPSYFAILSFASRVGPWPRSLGRPVSFALGVVGACLFVASLARFLCGPGGWMEDNLHVPSPAARQVRRAVWALAIGVIALMMPAWILEKGLIAGGFRPATAPDICRVLLIGFESLTFVVAARICRKRGPIAAWLTHDGQSRRWLARHDRLVAWLTMGSIAGVIVLDVQGFGFTARRVSAAGMQVTTLVVLGWCVYWLLVQAIDSHAWSWVRRGGVNEVADGTADVAVRLKRLAAWGVPILAGLSGIWYWNIDLALFRSITDQPIWPNSPSGITLGDALSAVVISGVTLVAWRHLGAFFAVAVFPRMADDPGVRFAVLTLCRYAVLGVGMMAAMASLHLGPERIGFGLAALGVGLGFGLQEIVSNFVSGIILLLERPIRVGDVVTVAGMSGKVERINIRATTIINADNQSLIVPNREFITANLVNWTHKDRILRVNVPLIVASGTDPDRVSEILMAIARDDADVLKNPVPAASMDGFGDFGMNFTLHVHVPDPGLAGRVKHRVCGEIQKRFRDAGILMPMPTREIVVKSAPMPLPDASAVVWPIGMRVDRGSATPPGPMGSRCPVCAPEPAEPSHRGVDE